MIVKYCGNRMILRILSYFKYNHENIKYNRKILLLNCAAFGALSRSSRSCRRARSCWKCAAMRACCASPLACGACRIFIIISHFFLLFLLAPRCARAPRRRGPARRAGGVLYLIIAILSSLLVPLARSRVFASRERARARRETRKRVEGAFRGRKMELHTAAQHLYCNALAVLFNYDNCTFLFVLGNVHFRMVF